MVNQKIPQNIFRHQVELVDNILGLSSHPIIQAKVEIARTMKILKDIINLFISMLRIQLQARERTLRSTIVTIAKLLCNFKEPDDIQKKEKFNKLKHYIDQILERIKRIDKEEYEESKKDLNKWIDDWKTGQSNKFGTQNNRSLNTKTLCYSFGTTPHKNFHGIKAWPILSSMRDVDKETELKIQD